tara:strand:- start:5184 stop:5711 length:528 start_codon:yes stop_codon:yes gene_type:complete
MNEILLAEFSNPNKLIKAAEALTDCGYTTYEVYSPFPIHGMDDAMNLKHSKLGWIVLCGGATGLLTGFFLQTWVSLHYPLIISGKPFFSYQAFIPVTFELMVLFSAFSAVFGMFALNRLPQHYNPLFKSSYFRKVTSHGFFIGIDSNEKGYDREKLRDLFGTLDVKYIEIIEDTE